jgi:hypothetical protein
LTGANGNRCWMNALSSWKKVLPVVRRANRSSPFGGSDVAIACCLQVPTKIHVAGLSHSNVCPRKEALRCLKFSTGPSASGRWYVALNWSDSQYVYWQVSRPPALSQPVELVDGIGGAVRITSRIGGAASAANAVSMASVFDRPQRVRNHLNVTD